MDIQQAINCRIMEQFAALGIEFAFPTQTLQISQDFKNAPGTPGTL